MPGSSGGGVTGVRVPGRADCLHERFAAVAARFPDRVAVDDRRRRLTYRELDVAANRLAHRLVRHGAGPGVLVGVCAERSVDLVVAVLGVLKAGAGYLPLDPRHPAARRELVLADAGCAILVGDAPRGTGAFVSPADPALADEPATPPSTPVGADDVAYVIYTSGSTGTPKGVVVEHANVTRLFDVTRPGFGFTEHDVWTMFHSPAFDFSVWELWGARLHGGRVVVVPHATSREPERFLDLLVAEGVTVLNQTPTAFAGLSAAVAAAGYPATALRLVVFGGEELRPGSLRPWVSHYGDDRPVLVNMYGITETTVHVTSRRIRRADLGSTRSPIGRPLPDLRVHVLDERRRPVPAGEVGEMYVAGPGVARGYLGRDELTAARFVTGPSGERVYRTGDLGSVDEAGELTYHGRVDDQVQLRGFRVEPGEVASVLRQDPTVRDAVVLLGRNGRGEPRLECYWTPVSAGDSDQGPRVRAALAERLPDYLVPTVFHAVAALPMTPNGKLDKAALTALPTPGPEPAAAPADPVEHAIASMWADLLELDSVGADDAFFSIGGDSILAIRFAGEAKAADLPVAVEDLFLAQTPRELARLCRERGSTGPAPAADERDPVLALPADYLAALPDDVVDAYPASALQQGIIFHAKLSRDGTVYHDLVAVHLAGALDVPALRAALDGLADAHEVLRTRFDLGGHRGVVQLVGRAATIPLTVRDAGPAPSPREALRRWWREEWRTGFDLTAAPLARCHVLRHADGTWHLAVAAHHAVLDGWSFASLMTELLTAYAGGAVASRGPRPAYRDFVALELREGGSEAARRFWADQLAGAPVLDFPAPGADAGGEPSVDPDVDVELPADLVDGVRRAANAFGVPPKSVFLTAHLAALARLTGVTDVVSGVVFNGRPEVAGAEHALGLFLNSLPFRVRLDEEDWPELAAAVFDTESRIVPHRRFPLAAIRREVGAVPFAVLFNYARFHVFDALADLPAPVPRDWFFSDRTNFGVVVEVGQVPLADRWELHVRTDPATVHPGVAGLLADGFRDVLAEIVAEGARR
ncbi:non-ribosomal peptide synthetase [Saccharothrix syringae]|uniref:Non-ribosomal peptide synthetase n=1 Tax=Saccharothrix syringae TaxID=103733 RepID=A0A5Q0H4C8_SACSY|nr:amino acid adenylation domain-containing protein [Saccharothrix syringae]QFZ20989.1 non-ribosomal peptide synthetase [Saccharothrix syringae]